MDITARQFGRIEAACYALAKLTEKDAVGPVLVNTIREQLDEVAETAYPGELDAARMDDFSDDDFDRNAGIRQYGREVIANGAGLIPAIRRICEHFNLTQKEFAEIIGTSATTLSMAMTGKRERDTLLCRMTEFFGIGKEA